MDHIAIGAKPIRAQRKATSRAIRRLEELKEQ